MSLSVIALASGVVAQCAREEDTGHYQRYIS